MTNQPNSIRTTTLIVRPGSLSSLIVWQLGDLLQTQSNESLPDSPREAVYFDKSDWFGKGSLEYLTGFI